MRARALPDQYLLRGGYKRGLHAFQGVQRHHGCVGAPEEKKRGGWGGREATAGEPVLVTPPWGLLYAYDAGVVSKSPEQLAEEEDGRDRGRVRSVWPHRIGGRD